MNRRDEIAARAMVALIVHAGKSLETEEDIAEVSVKYADALIKRLDQKEGQEMSDMEYHKGRARVFPRLDGETNGDYCRRWAAVKGLPAGEICEEDTLRDMFNELGLYGNRWARKGMVVNDQIWECLEHERADSPEELNSAIMGPDGVVTFSFAFYNGGASFTEIAEETFPDPAMKKETET